MRSFGAVQSNIRVNCVVFNINLKTKISVSRVAFPDSARIVLIRFSSQSPSSKSNRMKWFTVAGDFASPPTSPGPQVRIYCLCVISHDLERCSMESYASTRMWWFSQGASAKGGSKRRLYTAGNSLPDTKPTTSKLNAMLLRQGVADVSGAEGEPEQWFRGTVEVHRDEAWKSAIVVDTIGEEQQDHQNNL